MLKQPRGNGYLRAIGILVGLSLGYAGVFRPSVQSEINSACKQVNAKCPEQINDALRMDRVDPGEMRVTYHFTITTPILLTSSQMNQMKAEMMSTAHTNADTKLLLGKGVTLGFVFNDIKGKELINFDIPGKK